MPGALPEADDAYLCSSFKVKDWIETDTVFINKFHVKTTAKKVHHMLIYACDSPPENPGKIWYVFYIYNTHRYNYKLHFPPHFASNFNYIFIPGTVWTMQLAKEKAN